MAAGPPGWTRDASPEDILRAIVGPPERVRAALRVAAEELRGEWAEVLSQPGRGKFYEAGLRFITKGGRTIPVHDRSGVRRGGGRTASAPGDPPARHTGLMAASIAIDDSNPDELRIGPSGPRARILLAMEFGVNVSGSKVGTHPGGIVIEPRPSAAPALERARPKMIDGFRAMMARQQR